MNKLHTVLLIDDDDVTNFINESIIEETGITEELLIARNGLEALSIITNQCIIKGHCPDLILLDINMPVMNGFEFLEAYRQIEHGKRQTAIIIMLTTSMNPRDVKQSENYDIAAYIDKPLLADKLKQQIVKHFDSEDLV